MERIIFLVLACALFNPSYAKSLNENFDGIFFSKFTQSVLRSKNGSIAPRSGIENSNALKISYKGYKHGSKRVVATELFDEGHTTATLEFGVKFCPNFNFVKGGKLHGLGPVHPITGGKKITPSGWSARLMFRKNGGLMTYVYHQDMTGKFGTIKTAKDFKFIPDRYYKIKMIVHLNSQPDADDGWVNVYVDEEKVISHTNLRFRSVIKQESEINKFLFSTFHGGSTQDWAPLGGDGEYTTECAYFDDFSVIADRDHVTNNIMH